MYQPKGLSFAASIYFLEEYINDRRSDSATNTQPIIHTSKGPGELDKWAFVEGKKNCWQQPNISNKKSVRKKIIYCAGGTAHQYRTYLEEAILEALLLTREVYLWPGNDKPFVECTPITSISEFWDNRIKHSASKTAVEESLARQGIATTDLILDSITYNEMLSAYCSLVKNPPHFCPMFFDGLDLSNVTEEITWEFLQRVCNTDTVTKVRIGTFYPRELEAILKLSKLEEIETTSPLVLSMPAYMNLIPSHITLSISNIANEDIIVHADHKKMKLELSGYNKNAEIKRSSIHPTLLEELEINYNYYNVKLFCHPEQLKKLTLYKKNSLESFAPFSSLEELTLIDCRASKLNLDGLHNLKKLTLISNDVLQIVLPELPKLESITIISYYSTLLIDLTSLKNCKTPIKHCIERSRFCVCIGTEYLRDEDKIAYTRPKSLGYPEIYINDPNWVNSNIIYQDLIIAQYQINKNSYIPKSIAIEFRQNSSISDLNLDSHSELSKCTITNPMAFDTSSFSGCNLLQLLLKSININNFSIDFNKFKNLSRLEVIDVSIKSLDLSPLIMLRTLVLKNVSLDTLDLTQLPNLQRLVIENATIKKIIFKDLEKLRYLMMRFVTTESTIDLSQTKNLHYCQINAAITVVGFDHCHKLETLILIRNNITYDDIINLPNHKKIGVVEYFNDNGKLFLSIENCASLNHLEIHAKTILNSEQEQILNVSGCRRLRHMRVQCASEINISGINDCKNLHSFISNQQNRDSLTHMLPVDCINMGTMEQQNINQNMPVSIHHQRIRNLTAANDRSKVSRFSLRDLKSRSVTSKCLGQMVTYDASNDEMSVVIEGDTSVTKNGYRIQVKDRIKIDAKHSLIEFYSKPHKVKTYNKTIHPLDITKVMELKQELKKTPETAIAFFDGELIPGERYPLVTNAALCFETDLSQIYADPHNAFNIFWDEADKQFYIELKNKQPKKTVKILYSFQENKGYEIFPDKVPQTSKLLPKYAKQIVEKNLTGFTPLQFIFDSTLSIEEKLKRLAGYCKSFKTEALISNVVAPLQILFGHIKQPTGVCIHRAEAFMLLSHYLDVEAKLITNEQHAYCEIPDTQQQWHRIELGGAESYDVTPQDKRINIFDIAENQTNSNQNSSTRNQNTNSDSIYQQWEDTYYTLFSQLSSKNELASLLPKSQAFHSPLSPLVEIEPGKSAFALNQAILQEYEQNGLDTSAQYLYINDAHELAQNLRARYLENGKRVCGIGPLYTMIKQTGGVVVINWDNFTAAEKTTYKSLLDTKPTIMGEEVTTANFKVIGITSNINACSAFKSRCKAFKMDKSYYKQVSNNINTNTLNNPVINEVDLFNRNNFKDLLLGDIIFKGDQIVFEKGPLLQAILDNKPIKIYNSPKNNAEFNRLMYSLTVEKKLYVNNQMYYIGNGFEPILAIKQHPINAINVRNLPCIEPNDKRKRIFINSLNLNECIEQLHFNKAHQAETKDSILANYHHDKHILYFTETPSLSNMEYLIDHITRCFPDKVFDIAFAPRGERRETNHPAKEILEGSKTIITNHTDICTEELANQLGEDNVLIVDVTPQTSFAELMYDTEIKENIDGTVKFIYKEKQILEALKTEPKKTIILNGNLSTSLYLRLMPYLYANSAHIMANGEVLEGIEGIKGSLVSVQNNNSDCKSILTEYTQCTLNVNDYMHRLTTVDKDNLIKLNRLDAAIQKIPQHGIYRNIPRGFSKTRMYRCLEKLRTRSFHHNNPIKGIVHYHFPIRSNEYAYLCVLTKSLFGVSSDAPKLNVRKFLQSLQELNITSKEDIEKHIWKLLNCYNYYPDIENAMLLGTSGLPTVKPKLIDMVWAEMQILHASDALSAPKLNHVDKRLQQLNQLLDSSNSPVIVLKGNPGVGKTHAVREVLRRRQNIRICEGEDGIVNALTDSDPNTQKIILLDEANQAIDGTWDFLKGLSRNKKTIFYKGKEYPLTSPIKVIMTCNPEHYPQRHYHQLISDLGEVIYFKMPDDTYLAKNILDPLLAPHGLNTNKIIHAMLKVFHLVEAHNPFFPLSNRDLENFAQRYILLAKAKPEFQMTQLYHAGVGEFAGAISGKAEREKFIIAMSDVLSINITQPNTKYMIPVSNNCLIPAEKAYLVDGILQDLSLRANHLNTHQAGYLKKGIIIEGNAGLGKSTLYEEILLSQGFSKKATDTQKKYYMISAGTENVETILIQAFYEGAIVILDEINVDSSLEILLNQLCDDRDPTATAAINEKAQQIDLVNCNNNNTDASEVPKPKPGFMILASQNPSYFAGRESQSPALKNRMHFMYMENYSIEAEQMIAAQVPYPNACVGGYHRAKKQYGEATNTRTLYNGIKLFKTTSQTDANQNKVNKRTMDETSPQAVKKHKVEEETLVRKTG